MNIPLLHQLIKSLKPSNKRYFKLQSSLYSGKKNYVLLFDTLDSMDQFNEDTFASALQKQPNLLQGLAVTQNYLYQKILECLRHIHENDSVDPQLYNLLIEAQILEKRGLFELSNDLLDKAQRLASKYHKHYHLTEILRRKGNLVVALSTKNVAQEIEDTFSKALDSAQTLTEQLNYDFIAKWLFCQTAIKRYHTDNTTINKIQELIDTQLIEGTPNTDSFYVQYLYYKSWALYYYTQPQPEKARDSYLKIMELWEQFPEMKKEEQKNYIANISNLINALMYTKEYSLIPKFLDKLEEIQPTSFDEAVYIFQNLFFYKILSHLNMQQYSKALTLVPELLEKLPLYEHAIKQSRLLTIYYNIAITYFLNIQYKAALVWLDKIISITRTDETRKDIQRFARILQLAMYYQLGHHQLFENMIRNVYRSKVVQEDMQPFDKLIFKYFNRLQKYEPHTKEAIAEFKVLKKKLAELPKEQQLMTGFEDFSAWLEIVMEERAAR